MSFLTRRLVGAALTANALRPPTGIRSGIAGFFAGMPTDELAPQLLAFTLADTAVSAARGRTTKTGLAAAAFTVAGLGYVIHQARRTPAIVEDALVDGLGGVDYVEQLDAAPTPAELATPWRQIARPFRFEREGIRIDRNLPYSEAGKRGTLDIVRPAREDLSGAPVLLQIHGGAWTYGAKEQQGQPLMRHLAAKGWVCVAINYRLSPRDAWPAHIVDVKRAIAWVKEHIAEYGGDPGYLAITGGSAGGHLAALAALTPNEPAWQPGFEEADTTVQAAVPFYGVYDFAGSTGLATAERMRDLFLAPKVLTKQWADDPDVFEAASPILRITDAAPDFFVIHGTLDSLVDVNQARLFVARLREVSRHKVVYAELPGAQHAFDVFYSIREAAVVRAVDRFLTWSWNGHRRPAGASKEAVGP